MYLYGQFSRFSGGNTLEKIGTIHKRRVHFVVSGQHLSNEAKSQSLLKYNKMIYVITCLILIDIASLVVHNYKIP